MSIYDDSMTIFRKQMYVSRTGTEAGYCERHVPSAFRTRVQVIREAKALANASHLRGAECRLPRRKHSNLSSAKFAVVLTALSALSQPALSQDATLSPPMSVSPTFPPSSTPVAPPSGASSKVSSPGPTANMTAFPSMVPTRTGYPTTSAPIIPTSDSPTTTPTRIVSPSHRPTLSVNPTTAPTITPAPTFPPSLNPTITPMPTGNPSASPTDFPSTYPSEAPSPSPTFDEVSLGSTHLLQSFKVGNGRIFNESEVFIFEQIMTGYTYNIANGSALSKINATCDMLEPQTLLIVPERRTFRLRFLQDVVDNATNQVEYIMQWESNYVNVTDYPSLFTRFLEQNLNNLTLDLRDGGLDVLSSSSLRAVITTEAPSAAPSSIFKPTPNPVRPTTPKPTDSQSDASPASSASEEPSVAPANKPSSQGSVGSANVITNTIVIAVVLTALFVVSCCGCFLFYHRRKQLKELEFQAAVAAGRLSSEKDNKDMTVDENFAIATSAPYGNVPRSDDEQGIISPNESLLSNPSLISAGMSFGEGSIDEADRTHNLADAFDQYKDQNLEKVRADVQDLVIGSDSMMNQAMTLAFMGDEEIFADTRELISGGETDATEIEADLLCEVNDFLKRNEFADVEERKSFLQETTNKLVAYVLHGVIAADDASRTIHESAAMLGLELAAEIPENTVIVTGLRKNVTTAHLESAFREFGDLDEVAIASDARGFGLVRFLSPQSALRTMSAFREGEIVVQDVGVMVKVLKSDPVESSP
ncbi:hypothetical protein MHU86_7810 [Fragilaria crotonensis]|nr:hypothetical protein MHU86_7810 [Fragilaria crotonensis]